MTPTVSGPQSQEESPGIDPSIQALCVFCGASVGRDPAFVQAGETLGRILASENVTLVFGAGNVGIMGAVARAALSGSGTVVGIIPEHLTKIELPDGDGMDMHVVADMHTRKKMMFERSDAICVLPGGLGTLDETFEIMTWRQLGLHNKPVILVDVNGYWQPFLRLVESVIESGFAKPTVWELFSVVTDPADVLPKVRAELARTAAQPDLANLI